MSADFTTKNFVGYFHKDYVAVFDCNGDAVGSFTPEMVSELQSIVDRWKVARELLVSGVTVLLVGGPCDGQRREMDGRYQQIDVMPPVDLAAVTDPDTPLPSPARYSRTYRTVDGGAEIYRYDPSPLS